MAEVKAVKVPVNIRTFDGNNYVGKGMVMNALNGWTVIVQDLIAQPGKVSTVSINDNFIVSITTDDVDIEWVKG